MTDDLRDEDLDYLWNNVGGDHGFVRALIDEVRRHRSALAADMERVRSVVAGVARQVAADNYDLDETIGVFQLQALASDIATRAAEQLATGGVGLSETDRGHLRDMRERERVTKLSLCHLGAGINESCDARMAILDRLLGASK